MPEGGAGQFLGWRAVAAAFVLAMFGWGLGFYGPPLYLHAVREARGWPLSLVSAAVTVHFLTGALIVARLPSLHRRLGIVTATRLGGVGLALGVAGWAFAREPWQLFAAAAVSGAGWAGTSAAAINAILSPWFDRQRPKALALAYNGASFGGILFQPLWVAGLLHLGFMPSAVIIGLVTVLLIWVLAGAWFSRSPQGVGQRADGDVPGSPAAGSVTPSWVVPLPGRSLGGSWQFRTLILATMLSMFAQAGLMVQLFSHLVPAMGAAAASWLMTGATVAAMGGRTAMGLVLGPRADRRLAVSSAVAVQLVASLALLAAGGSHVPALIVGTLLFGLGLGNAVSLPPLIAQAEFSRVDVPRVVSLTVASSQATYAIAPAAFAVLIETGSRSGAGGNAAPLLFTTAAAIQAAAIAIYLVGRRKAA